MYWVVAYDIRDDRRRRAVEKNLRAHGIRIQYSVFECRVGGPKLKRLQEKLRSASAEEDSIVFYPLCVECRDKKIVLRGSEATVPGGDVVV